MKCSHAVLVLSGQEGVAECAASGSVCVKLAFARIKAAAVSLAVTLSSLSCVGTWGLRCVDVNMALSSGGITIVRPSIPSQPVTLRV